MNKLKVLRDELNYEYVDINLLEAWVCGIDVNFTHAVTLTFAKNESDRVIAERVFGVFLHYLNERIYRRAYRNKSKRLKVAAVLEGLKKNHQRLHFHLAIEIPNYITQRCLREELQFCWDKANKTRENDSSLLWLAKQKGMTLAEVVKYETKRNNRVDIDRFSSNGWINYIAKEFHITNMDCRSEHCYF